MSPELIAILAVGVGLAGLIVPLLLSERRERRADSREAKEDRAAIRQELHALAERVARIEGALPFIGSYARTPDKPAA